ncbi:MAG: tRNA (cytidine(34)-2'-O)-methyltransferase [Deltaproteobacteria bacterium]|nr:tRNA (cytidine(34)-2'-O)-methyltransferase [Deltaproteobacteria bacterium]
MEVVLYQPLIPQNVGAVARTCAATDAVLHLIRPFPFELSEKAVRRAGLDYWHLVKVIVWESWTSYWEVNQKKKHWGIEVDGKNSIFEVKISTEDVFVFGKETTGLDYKVREAMLEILRIPVKPDTVRSLNLSNCVAITLYEALRQTGFKTLSSDQ